MKIKCTIVFEFDSCDQSLEECKDYLNGCTAEVIEWMPEDTGFTLEAVE